VRIEIFLKGMSPSILSFQGGERLILFPIGLFSFVEETRVYLPRKPSVLGAGATSTLFPSEKGVGFGKEYFLPI
jgi:hypothetical protein